MLSNNEFHCMNIINVLNKSALQNLSFITAKNHFKNKPPAKPHINAINSAVGTHDADSESIW